MKTRWRFGALLAACLCLDGCLAICQYPSLAGTFRILEISLFELQAGLVIAVLTIFRAGGGRARAAGFAGAWILFFVGLGTLTQWRQNELDRLGEQAAALALTRSGDPSLVDCRVVDHRPIWFMARMDYQLRCGSRTASVAVYFDRGQVESTAIH